MKTANTIKTSLVMILAVFISASISSDVFAQKKPGHGHKKHHHHHHHAHAKHKPHRHYAHLPRLGAVVKVTPSGAVKIKHAGVIFHFHKGVWYKPKGGSFVVVRPAPGIKVGVLPPKRKRIVLGPKVYFYYYGTFYRQVPDKEEYEVVDAPAGAQVDALPEGYETKTIEGTEYYLLDDVYYKALEKDDGETVYEVVDMD